MSEKYNLLRKLLEKKKLMELGNKAVRLMLKDTLIQENMEIIEDMKIIKGPHMENKDIKVLQ
jgi:hypothetical protein